MNIGKLLKEQGDFKLIYKINGFTYVVNEMKAMTGMCIPRLRNARGLTPNVIYEIAIVILPETGNPEQTFIDYVRDRRHLALHRLIKPIKSLERIIRDGQLSDWILSDMKSAINEYTLTRDDALALIDKGTDPFISRLKRLYRGKFDDLILTPLRDLPATRKW